VVERVQYDDFGNARVVVEGGPGTESGSPYLFQVREAGLSDRVEVA
jgi:hypothetical protein